MEILDRRLLDATVFQHWKTMMAGRISQRVPNHTDVPGLENGRANIHDIILVWISRTAGETVFGLCVPHAARLQNAANWRWFMRLALNLFTQCFKISLVSGRLAHELSRSDASLISVFFTGLEACFPSASLWVVCFPLGNIHAPRVCVNTIFPGDIYSPSIITMTQSNSINQSCSSLEKRHGPCPGIHLVPWRVHPCWHLAWYTNSNWKHSRTNLWVFFFFLNLG